MTRSNLLIAVAIMLLGACVAKSAEYTIAFTATWCGPCQQMQPVEAACRALGHDIRPVDIDQRPDLRDAYRVTRIPCFVRVIETPRGPVELGRITGICTAGQLQRLAATPALVTVGAAARSCVRSILGAPTPVFPAW